MNSETVKIACDKHATLVNTYFKNDAKKLNIITSPYFVVEPNPPVLISLASSSTVIPKGIKIPWAKP